MQWFMHQLRELVRRSVESPPDLERARQAVDRMEAELRQLEAENALQAWERTRDLPHA